MSFRPPRPLTARWRPVEADGLEHLDLSLEDGDRRRQRRDRQSRRGALWRPLSPRLRRGLGDPEPRPHGDRRPRPPPPLRRRRANGPTARAGRHRRARRLHRHRPRRLAVHQHAPHPPRGRLSPAASAVRVPDGLCSASTRSSRSSTGNAIAASRLDRLYRYEAADRSFTADLTVDEDGLVIDYPGLFARLSDLRDISP